MVLGEQMTLTKFKTEVRQCRGKLTRHDQDLEDIYNFGIPGLVYFTLDKKLMGISNIAWMALQPKAKQEQFITWMSDKNWKASKNELEMWK